MKRILLGAACLLTASAVGQTYREELTSWLVELMATVSPILGDWGSYLLPVCLMLILLAVLVTRKSAGQMPGQPVPTAAEANDLTLSEHPVVQRATARAIRSQLMADQILLQNRERKLPDEIKQAERDVCYAETAVSEAESQLNARIDAHEAAMARLAQLRAEQTRLTEELTAMAFELAKLDKRIV